MCLPYCFFFPLFYKIVQNSFSSYDMAATRLENLQLSTHDKIKHNITCVNLMSVEHTFTRVITGLHFETSYTCEGIKEKYFYSS